MCPALVLLLLLAAPTSANTGRKFLVAFPENVAYYHPVVPTNVVRITALHHGTRVTVGQTTFTLAAGETAHFTFYSQMELRDEEISNKAIVVDSTKAVAVHAISQRGRSVQTALVIPADRLGTEYLIPPIPSTQGADEPGVTERPFKLVIINTDQENTVTVEGPEPRERSLGPWAILQVWVREQDELRSVRADRPVAVLFAHPCAMRHNCTCGLLHSMLSPARQERLKFLIPPALAADAHGETLLLLAEKGSTKTEAFNPESPLVEAAGSAVLYRPGLLLPLIPETDFASCFVVNIVADMQGFAVITVHKDFKEGVHIENRPLVNPEWQELKGTEYVSTKYVLTQVTNVLWHTSTKMAVYFVGNNGNALFGNPAAVISTTPDLRGCTVIPEVVTIGKAARGWRESVKYCRDNNMELVNISDAQRVRQIFERIGQANSDGVREVWIGMRRSVLTGEWYWLNESPVGPTHWKEGEPGAAQEGQCALMSLQRDEDFGWSDEDCCKAAYPVCYIEPLFLPLAEQRWSRALSVYGD